MLYLRSDATRGFSGGYHYETGGMTTTDPNTTAAKRKWTSLDVGTDIYRSDDAAAEWILRDFDIIVPQAGKVTAS
ncbi:hypothetical protein MUK42_35208 [Musa troglodytarum]|uniref:DUF7705 domain-containing protein n=1 Tax=Musa troglodytarum TaxID=320322 RepID=A0A9E7HFJ6_9LILI|nr:hypothetical protein MUK42_35208 [Musa troglodytarum]